MDKFKPGSLSPEDSTFLGADKAHPLADERGFSIMEVMIAASLMLVVALGVATMQSSQSKGNKVFASQASNVNLASSLRTQLSRRQTCLPSFVVPPANFSGTNDVAVRLGPNATDTVVQAGQDLKNWKLRIASLQVRNLNPYGTTNTGRSVYIGDLFLKAQSAELDPGKRVDFKELPVAHLTFEVNGGTLEACYAGDTYSDTTQQLQTVCNMINSPAGVPGYWDGSRCIVNDDDPQATCQAQGGVWDGSSCIQNGAKVCISQNNYWDGANCIVPPNKTCAAQGGSWNGSTCVMPANVTCSNLGMDWNGSNCLPRQDLACARMGAGYSWNGSTCTPPAGNPAAVCASLGMAWVSGFCQPGLDYASGIANSASTTTVYASCPYPRQPTGGTCLSSLPNITFNDGYYLAGRQYYCSWDPNSSGALMGQTVVAQVRCL